MMVDILFVFAKLHADISYRQVFADDVFCCFFFMCITCSFVMGVVICFLSYSNDVASPCFMKFSHLFMLLESHFSCLNLPVMMALCVCVTT